MNARRLLTLLVLGAAGLAVPAPAAAAPGARRVVIGTSVRGRPIVAWSLGSNQARRRVLIIGVIHGNETAGLAITSALRRIRPPRGVQLWLVPELNPDGVAADTRQNADGVDLNRNFPFRWRPLGGGEYSGTRPLSEPESRTAQRLVLREKPDLTIWFHQPFGLVDKPEGNPFAARRFADLIGLPLVRLRGPYPGSASRWQNHTFPHSTAFVVELPHHVGNALVNRGVQAVRTLAAELASPSLDPANSGTPG